jgi:hypothetical protein
MLGRPGTVDGSDKTHDDGPVEITDATRRSLADFLSMSARPTRDPRMLEKALRDSLALSALHKAEGRHENAKGAGETASPLN